jgi:hypothetical protein
MVRNEAGGFQAQFKLQIAARRFVLFFVEK